MNLESTGCDKWLQRFFCQKLANICSFVVIRIIVKQKKISIAERNWMNPLNALQEAIHYSFIKFFIYCFSVWYEFFVYYAIKVQKNYQHVLEVGPFEFQFLRPRRCLTSPFRTLSLYFGVIGKTPGLISRNNFVKNFLSAFVIAIKLWQDASRSLLSLLRCQGVWNKTCTQLSLSKIFFQNPKKYRLGDVQRFCFRS